MGGHLPELSKEIYLQLLLTAAWQCAVRKSIGWHNAQGQGFLNSLQCDLFYWQINRYKPIYIYM